ncbi:L-rhamnose mutarotase [Alginatibacterium sediminis]|uniref:L-rhamnose mutarotase n=1 Tax=Alginatibacterium sediminis TaxID=2164068 RepID=A0A420EGJ3_9ALTE|nr:L-rhamnose mutarotase [Alginatibacterium sediminis]RKF19784.1 L-rhamnose mutarotase [Alginatibacterium sediminis]
MDLKRVGSVIEIKADQIEHYRELHANQWDSITSALSKACLSNYSIYLRQLPDKKYYLFSYFEYTGTNFEQDMALLGDNADVQAWWDICKPMHLPFSDRAEGEWWASMDEVFHQD